MSNKTDFIKDCNNYFKSRGYIGIFIHKEVYEFIEIDLHVINFNNTKLEEFKPTLLCKYMLEHIKPFIDKHMIKNDDIIIRWRGNNKIINYYSIEGYNHGSWVETVANLRQ